MDSSRIRPPAYEIARYVTLYRARNIKPWEWDTVGDTYHRSIVDLTRVRHRLIRVARGAARQLHEHVGAVDEMAAAAVAFVLLDDGQSYDVVGRFIIPGWHGEQLEDEDPRTALRRALVAPASPQKTMGLMLKAWGMWVTGSTCREMSWREDAPIPRVAGWPTFSIPTPPDCPK